MRRIVLLMALGVVAACRHDDGAVSTTTIRSGTLEGARLIDTPPASFDPADRLTTAVCRHQRDCAARRAHVSAAELLRREEACTFEVTPAAQVSMDALDCAPSVAQAGLADCLAALDVASCDPAPGIIPACRPRRLCRRPP
jgi:hypothetical protein